MNEVFHHIEIESSVANLFDKSTIYTLSYPMEGIYDLVSEAGYSGLEWFPFRSRANRELMKGQAGEEAKQSIHSLHQSYRSERSLFEAFGRSNRMLAVSSFILLPERSASLPQLASLQGIIGKELPIVLYPPDKREDATGLDLPFAEKLFQPIPRVMKNMGVSTVEELITLSKERGYTGFCVDLAHMRSSDIEGISLNPWQETLPQLLPFTKEIHVAAGRVDMPYAETIDELKDLIHGTRHTDLSKMLIMINELGWKGRVVTEIPATALHALHNNSRFLSPHTFIEDHKAIIHSIQSLLF